MSLYDDASLIMYPSGYKEDKLYSLKPTNGDGDFTFTRASSATRVNAEGLIEEVPYNKLTYSNDFSQWGSSTRVFRNSGQSGYDGTNDAWLMVPTTTNNTHLVGQVVAGSGTKTISIYAKGGGYNYFSMRDNTSYAKFDLDLGVSATNGAGAISSTINSVGDGWYKCTFTYTKSVDGNVVFYINNTYDYVDAFEGNETSGVYFQDAQINKGSTAKPYFPTTDRLNVPRLDYSGGASCASLLLEPQRTNQNENYIDYSLWAQGSAGCVTITASSGTAPNGNNELTLIKETSTTSRHGIFKNYGGGSGDWCLSNFFKAPTNARFVRLVLNTINGADFVYATFDLETGTITQSVSAQGAVTAYDAQIEDYGNGIYRCWVSGSLNLVYYTIAMCVTGTAAAGTDYGYESYAGDNTSGILSWGSQIESGRYPTSIIPTSGSTVTRTADACNGAGTSATFNDSEGVLMVEASALANVGTNRMLSLSDGSTNNRVLIKYDNIANRLEFFVFSGGSSQYTLIELSLVSTLNNKIAFKYKENDFAVWANGFELDTNTSGSTPIGLSELAFNDGAGGNEFYGKTKQLQYFDTALTDSKLEQLTSWSSFSEMATAQQYTII